MSGNILRIVLFALACSLLFVFTACFGNPPAQPQPTPEPIATAPPAPTPPENNTQNTSREAAEFTQADIDAFNLTWLDLIPEAEGSFELSAEERAIYEEYILTGDLSVLEGVNPVSVLKIWLQTGIDGRFEREFFLLHPDTVHGLTVYEYIPQPGTPIEFVGTVETRQRWADLYFSRIADGKTEIEGDLAIVSFYTETGEHMPHRLRLNEDGIWLVELLY
ncbi:MAG: hypothetical protein FWE92_05825 [Defluviitaleaceae bacterium]|nr:hypothetical protein [Defluviitaleaceae bacterium]